jgi:hypothetical protein
MEEIQIIPLGGLNLYVIDIPYCTSPITFSVYALLLEHALHQDIDFAS